MSTLPFHDFYVDRVLLGYHGKCVRNGLGCRPRGTYTRARPGSLEYMLVLQNPGEPIAGVEDRLEDGASPQELAARLWSLTGQVLEGHYHSRTLSTALREACELIGAAPQQCMQQVLFTNLVRCTVKAGHHLNDEAIRIGLRLLQEEVELWRPRYVIACGSIARDAMRKSGIRLDDDLPHPAARGVWLDSNRRLARIQDVRSHLAA